MSDKEKVIEKKINRDGFGRFIKGISSWNKGKKMIHSGSFKKGHKVNLGKHWKMSETGRKNISKRLKGTHPITEFKKGIHYSPKTEFKKGQHNSPSTEFKKGNKGGNWNGGISFDPYSVDWTETLRKSIRERDKYICQLCSKPQGDIAHDARWIKILGKKVGYFGNHLKQKLNK